MLMANLDPVEGLVDVVAAIFRTPSLPSIREVGVFLSPEPEPHDRTASNAIRQAVSNVGIASWALNSLYMSCKRRLLENQADFCAATTILLVSPDFLTAWNVRKTAFKPCEAVDELHFTGLIITRNPKSAETWAHRHWVLRTVGFDRACLTDELRLTWMASSRVPCNYYATVHRLRILPFLSTTTVVQELGQSRAWLQTHGSDSSGWTYHRMLLQQLVQAMQISIADEEIWFQNMSRLYPSTCQNVTVHCRWLKFLKQSKAEEDQYTTP